MFECEFDIVGGNVLYNVEIGSAQSNKESRPIARPRTQRSFELFHRENIGTRIKSLLE